MKFSYVSMETIYPSSLNALYILLERLDAINHTPDTQSTIHFLGIMSLGFVLEN
jgi:hypothetical protein